MNICLGSAAAGVGVGVIVITTVGAGGSSSSLLLDHTILGNARPAGRMRHARPAAGRYTRRVLPTPLYEVFVTSVQRQGGGMCCWCCW